MIFNAMPDVTAVSEI